MNQVLEASLLPPECPIAGSWIGRRVAGIWIRHSSISCWCPKCHLITALYSIDDVVGNDLATVALDTSCESSKNPLLNEKKKKIPLGTWLLKIQLCLSSLLKGKPVSLHYFPTLTYHSSDPEAVVWNCLTDPLATSTFLRHMLTLLLIHVRNNASTSCCKKTEDLI